ncbi:MAG: acylneuraminate cytidylyltransferase [Bacteroidales bacterium]|nr:acylneuraminate cytidylyltransferase [Bacteroidales bacterium]
MVVAFIPVRGGSKSIPLKNIKPLCGKPLVWWNIEAAQGCESIDRVVVSTDSEQIADSVRACGCSKVEVFRRGAESASDTASTESAMLEYINATSLADDVTFVLMQATSPLTTAQHLDEALTMYRSAAYDSILSCVRTKRFYWSEQGEPLNYDYMRRPRRQEFAGIMMENGAFYISTIGNIRRSGNRLSGRIGVYEMPDYTAVEIDEPDDWAQMEQLMRRHAALSRSKLSDVQLFLTDVDGVLTDAGMYYSEQGDELKKFNTRDGMGLNMIRQAGIKTGIITSETTRIVERRAAKLQIDYVRQGAMAGGKLEAAKEIAASMGTDLLHTAYIGDDINCKELLSAVGVAACPADAMDSIKQVPGILHLRAKGGEGAVREFVELILQSRL